MSGSSTNKRNAYIHIDVFLARRGIEMDDVVAKGFKNYMKGRQYQKSMEDFDKALHEFLTRFEK